MKLLPQTLSSVPIRNDVGNEVKHLFDVDVIDAVNAALAVNRPLLIYGETGIGKSQLAKAVARQLERVFIPFVCDVHTESRDLLWHFDAVARLAEAQLQGSLSAEERQTRQQQTGDSLAIKQFIIPKPLWWALNWGEAANMPNKVMPTYQEPCRPDNGTVVLIDEIDKTAADVPNGLLEVLGHGRFQPQGMDHAIETDRNAVAPLIIITSNGERNLPDAFIRRCLVLHLEFPQQADEQRAFLLKRAQENFPEFAELILEDEQNNAASLLERAADMLIEDRQAAKDQHLYPLCGQAEYFDLLRGIRHLSQQDYAQAGDLLAKLRPYIYQKVRS